MISPYIGKLILKYGGSGKKSKHIKLFLKTKKKISFSLYIILLVLKEKTFKRDINTKWPREQRRLVSLVSTAPVMVLPSESRSRRLKSPSTPSTLALSAVRPPSRELPPASGSARAAARPSLAVLTSSPLPPLLPSEVPSVVSVSSSSSKLMGKKQIFLFKKTLNEIKKEK